MKAMKLIAILFGLSLLSSCVIVTEGPGPNGLPGRAYFGIDYDYDPPYSYWDDNPNVPLDPYFAEYYRTEEGVYEFEYFINEEEYWYGTYEIWINPGEPGRPHGVAGRDGADTRLLLICNPERPLEYRKNAKKVDYEITQLSKGEYELSYYDEGGSIKIIMQKTTVNKRPTDKVAKFVSK